MSLENDAKELGAAALAYENAAGQHYGRVACRQRLCPNQFDACITKDSLSAHA